MFDLRSIGFDDHFQRTHATLDPAGVPARIAVEHRGILEAWWAGGSGPCHASRRIRQAEEGPPGVGDWVLLDAPPHRDRPGLIRTLLPRRTRFTRAAAGRANAVQVIAANVDLVLVLTGLDADWSLHRIERYLARVAASGATAAVVLTKADLAEDVPERVARVQQRCPGVAVFPTGAPTGLGLDALRPHLGRGVTVALVGSSGAGKSTLVNALVGTALQVTRPTRASDGQGTHTTTTRQLVCLPDGGVLLDTPGMRELAVHEEDGLAAVFEDVTDLATRCRFRDCTHENEPGCAILAALADGRLHPDRLAHHQALEREARAWQRRSDERLQRASDRAFGRATREIRLRSKRRGEPYDG